MMRYLHVTKEQLINIVSPIDDLFKKGEIGGKMHCRNDNLKKHVVEPINNQ